MKSRGSSHRLPLLHLRSRISYLTIAMFSTIAAVYVAGRLWQDSQNRVHLIKELDRREQGRSAVSVEDTLKVVACRQQHKRLAALEMELAAARQEGFVGKYTPETNGSHTRKRLMAVIGITTGFGQKNSRDAIRRTWLPTGAALRKLEKDKGIIIRFVIGRSANPGDSMDRAIDEENRRANDFLILEDHVETSEELPKKTKLFFVHATDKWVAEFYAKVNDNIYVNIDGLGVILASYLDKPRAYIGCMKSGEVFSDLKNKWYEPDWWKFGDGKSYFQHASGEIFVVSRALAQYISINRSILRTYAHDDVSTGSWLIGIDAEYVSEGKLCCSTWSSGSYKAVSSIISQALCLDFLHVLYSILCSLIMHFPSNLFMLQLHYYATCFTA